MTPGRCHLHAVTLVHTVTLVQLRAASQVSCYLAPSCRAPALGPGREGGRCIEGGRGRVDVGPAGVARLSSMGPPSPPFPSRVGSRSFPAQSPAPSPEILQPVPRPWPCPSALPLRLGEGPSAPCRRPLALPAGCPGHLRQSGAARSRAGCGGCGPGTESGAGVAGGGAPSAASRAQAWRLSLCIPQQGRSPGPSPHRHPDADASTALGPGHSQLRLLSPGRSQETPARCPRWGRDRRE